MSTIRQQVRKTQLFTQMKHTKEIRKTLDY